MAEAVVSAVPTGPLTSELPASSTNFLDGPLGLENNGELELDRQGIELERDRL